MIELESVLPAEVIEHANIVVELQSMLMNLSEDSFEATITRILELPFVKYDDGVKSITDSTLLAVQYRPRLFSVLGRLIVRLHSLASSENSLESVKRHLLRFQNKMIEERWRVAFIHELYCLSLYSEDEIYAELSDYMRTFPILSKQPYWKNRSRQHFFLFVWFAPLIKKYSPETYDDLLQRLFVCKEHKDLTTNFIPYLDMLTNLPEGNWEIYEKWARNIYLKDSLAQIIKDDNIELFKEIASEDGFDINQAIDTPVFEYSYYLLRQPTMLQFAAYYGSENIFFYLFARGADVAIPDHGKRTTLHFAIAGGNMNIIQIFIDAQCDFKLATRIACEFHYFDLFLKLLEIHSLDIKENDMENGSIFHGIASANHIRMILYCIQRNCNVNLKDGDGWFPLNCAIDYSAIESVYIMLNHKDIDANAQDDYGITPLLRACINCDVDVVRLLLTSPAVDINEIGLYSQTALHRATQNNSIDVMKLLLQCEGINVNPIEYRVSLNFMIELLFISQQ